ncbi:Hypothetical protein PHPALM_13399 [Phytophthora palmivora]|uniref:Uncharacterized protein n=1 Tax=Phytophthora palmivora TaxID=4796 RepID=A0A2P4XXC6_9STRA|nr:Hypothetical protein PHPALM_13399 [Phytophthora palmivora]
MSISAFVPTNTQKARATAISAFKRMLELKGVNMEFLHASILNDSSGKRLAATMDRLDYYLATKEGKNGKLAQNTASSELPNDNLMRRYLDLGTGSRSHMKRLSTTPEPFGSRSRTAQVGADYQDAALACLMWHCFGRSSDLGYVQKQHVSVSADGAFYVRLLWVKTTEEQGLTLVRNKNDFLSCPLLTLSVALAIQEAPCASLLGHLPALNPQAATPLDTGVPLHDVLAGEPVSLQVTVVTTPCTVSATHSSSPASACTTVSSTPPQKKSRGGNVKRSEDSMQGHVNRMLKRVAEPAGVATDLTYHSFRRGGAQHANSDEHLAA